MAPKKAMPPPKPPTVAKSSSKHSDKEASKKKALQTHSASKRPRQSESPSVEATPDPLSPPRREAARLALAQMKSALDAELISSDEDEEEEEELEEPKKDRRSHHAEPRHHSRSHSKSSRSERGRTSAPSSAMGTEADDEPLGELARKAAAEHEEQEEEEESDVQMFAIEQAIPGQLLESEWLRALPDPEDLYGRFTSEKNPCGLPPALDDGAMQKRVERRITTPGPEFCSLLNSAESTTAMSDLSQKLMRFVNETGPGPRNELRKLISKTQWKAVIGLPRSTFRTIGRRQAYGEERAYLNLMRCLPKNLVEVERIVARVEKDVSCTKNWLEAFEDNQVRSADIWKRWMCQCSKLRELNDSVVAIECRDPTTVVARGLANTSLIARLLCDYSDLAFGKAGELLHIELANGGLYAVSKFARKHCSWCLGLEDIVLLAMDYSRKGQAAFEGKPIQSEFRKRPEEKLDFYIGKPVYDYKEDSDLLGGAKKPAKTRGKRGRGRKRRKEGKKRDRRSA